jgi:hypothetical protein
MMTVATRKQARVSCLILGPIGLLIVLFSGMFPATVPAGSSTNPPISRIIYPSLAQSTILRLGETLTVRATGEDPDSSSSTGLPVAYLFKVLRLDTLDPRQTVLTAHPSLLMNGGDSTWTRYEGDTLDVSQSVAVPGEYMVGVRAIGESGETEIDLALGRNVFKFQAFPYGGRPDVTLREPSAGTFLFHDSFDSLSSEVPANTPLLFTWEADASRYGGTINAYSWGVDLADPNAETGWSGWSFETSTGAPLQFESGTHMFYVRARDTVGAIMRGVLTFQVIDMPFDREVLIVDDSFDNLAPNDSEHDAFWQDLVDDYVAHSNLPADQFFAFSVFGDNDRGNLQPNVPGLGELGRYKVLIWVASGYGYNSDSALIQCTGLSTRLAAYLRAGGKLWLEGAATVAATIPDANNVGADLSYPITTLGPGYFAWDYLKLHSTKIMNDKGADHRHLMHSVWPFPGAGAPYDSMVVDVSKLPLLQQVNGGFAHSDAVFNPLLAESEPGFEGDLDTLYAYGAAGPEVQGQSSVYQGKLCALRWHDTSLNPVHGRVQWFGFSMYYMQAEQARNTFRQSLDWLRQNDGVTPVNHVSFTGLRYGSQVVVRWDVAEEWQTSAFYIYREEAGREREKVSAAFSGSLHYEFVDRNAPSGPVSYWINEQDRAGGMSWYGPLSIPPSPTRTLLAPVLPNPITGKAELAYTLDKAGHVALSVHDVSGRQVALLVNDTQDAGRHELTWNPMATERGRLAAGFYVIRLQTDTASDVKKVLVLP